MPKISMTDRQRTEQTIHLWPDEFLIDPDGKLFCKLCRVNCSVASNAVVRSHRSSFKHSRHLSALGKDVPPPITKQQQQKQQLLRSQSSSDGDFSEKLAEAFLAADIPLEKLNCKSLKDFFKSNNLPPASESNCLENIEKIKPKMVSKIQIALTDSDVFVIFNYDYIENGFYACTLIGTVDKPLVSYLVSCKPIDNTLTPSKAGQLIDDALRPFKIKRERFRLLITTGDKLMTEVSGNLRLMYPKMMHVFCISQLMLEVALEVRAYFSEVDTALFNLEAALHKNKRVFFDKGLSIPPSVTDHEKWGCWLKAARFLAENLSVVESAFLDIEQDDDECAEVLVQNILSSLKSKTLKDKLSKVVSQYSTLLTLWEENPEKVLFVDRAYSLIIDLKLGADCCKVREIIKKRLSSSDVGKIFSMARVDLDEKSKDYITLLTCHATISHANKCFEMLKRDLCSDQSSGPVLNESLIFCKYNSFLIS